MSIYEDSKGRWHVKQRDEFGREYRKVVGSKQAAVAVDEQLKDSAAMNRKALRNLQHSDTRTLQEARDVYLANLRASELTKKNMTQRLAQFTRDAGQPACSMPAHKDLVKAMGSGICHRYPVSRDPSRSPSARGVPVQGPSESRRPHASLK